MSTFLQIRWLINLKVGLNLESPSQQRCTVRGGRLKQSPHFPSWVQCLPRCQGRPSGARMGLLLGVWCLCPFREAHQLPTRVQQWGKDKCARGYVRLTATRFPMLSCQEICVRGTWPQVLALWVSLRWEARPWLKISWTLASGLVSWPQCATKAAGSIPS